MLGKWPLWRLLCLLWLWHLINMNQEQREPSEEEVVEMLRYLQKQYAWAVVYACSVYVLQLVLVFAMGVVVGENW